MKKLFVFFLGMFFALTSLETILRMAPSLYPYNIQSNHSKSSGQEDRVNILCLGNSFTVGGGAPEGKSYPDQLQEMLNHTYGKDKYHVYNYGVSAITSSELLSSLDRYLEEVHPNIVILRAGGPNFARRISYYSSYKRFKNPIISYCDSFFRSFKSYKLFTRLIFEQKKALYDRDIIFETVIDNKTNEYYATNSLNLFKNLTSEELQKSLNQLQVAVEKDPTLSTAYGHMGTIYLHRLQDIDKAFYSISKGIVANPLYDYNPNYEQLKVLYNSHLCSNQMRTKIDNFINDTKRKYPETTEIFGEFSDQKVSEWLYSDLLAITNILKSYNIPFIIQNYPPWVPPKLQKRVPSTLLRNFAKNHGYEFIDVENNFLKIFKQGEDPDKYYSKIAGLYEGHINAEGYRLNAKWILEKLQKSHFLQDKKLK